LTLIGIVKLCELPLSNPKKDLLGALTKINKSGINSASLSPLYHNYLDTAIYS
jgi:hypothetical protein